MKSILLGKTFKLNLLRIIVIKMKNKLFLSTILIFVLVVASAGCIGQGTEKKIVIGTMPYNEEYILGHMISLLLEDAGYKTEVKEGLGGTLINYEALKREQINVFVGYTGAFYNTVLKLPALDNWDPNVVYNEVEKGLKEKEGITVVTKLGFKNNYAISVPRSWAEEKNLTKVSQLAPYAPSMVLGTDIEYPTAPDGLPTFEKAYGFKFKDVKSMEPTLVYEAIKNKLVDVITGYTTDKRGELFDLVVLEDDKGGLLPYDAIIITTTSFAKDEAVVTVLKKLEGKIDDKAMADMNYQYDIEKKESRDIARAFLISQGLIKN
ncbi:MAG: Substrate binding domain of ABC-type glycine betaine transport system [Candidatus Methanofastidiosum methylothiophilum]|uniref:Substrate binding domain of ABC-type glycine betaine transport system n=1 Tax=Candidatus Methanofastidiosum methylothiophilum TaxID=1705564 RepID=A0A150J8Z3_9EURY|nr:MAG: Substrate binding domain of ABC-type glycine betaine transport system [Candidatus Methanofastidiosum methylthiophilus]